MNDSYERAQVLVIVSGKPVSARAVIVEEGHRSYGIGAEVAARLQEEAFDYMDAPIKRVAQQEVPLPYSQELEQSALINVDRVVSAVKEVL